MEDKEDELMGTTKPSSFSRAALSIPAEGVYDTIKDTKNSAGVMIERRFYKSGKLTEKRTYTSTGSTDCRMRNKYLYYSDGATLERHRTYLNTGATCYNTNTKRYGTNKKLEWQLIYDGSKGYAKEGRYYDITAAYYTRIDYYTAGKKTIKHYWLGATGNRVTHVANLNSAGTEWLKATYYYDYTNKKVKQVINYTGKTPNLRTNETYYGTTGIKEWYRTYDSTGDLYHLTYYQANGIKKQEARYLKGTGVWTWDIKYQANGVDRESVRYRNEDNIYTRQLYYYAAGSKLKYDILYDDEGIKTSAKVYDEETGKLKQDECYVDGKIDVVEYYNLEGETTRKVRYFKDGEHLRWDINYVDNKKESVKLYDNKSNYEYKEIYKYTEFDKELDELLKTGYSDLDDKNVYTNVFNNELFAMYIIDRIELTKDSAVYIEDLKIINDIDIKNTAELEEKFSSLAAEEEIVSIEDGVEENIEEAKETLQSISFDSISGIGYLTELERLQINHGQISTIPSEIKTLESLIEINLSDNEINTICPELVNLKKIEKINLENNSLSTTSMLIPNLNNMKELKLAGNFDITFLSKDLITMQKNNSLTTFTLDNEKHNVRYIESDIQDYDDLYSGNYLGNINVKDTITIKSYKEDEKLQYYNFIIPEFTRKVIDDLNTKNLNAGVAKIVKVSDDTEYKIDDKSVNLIEDEKYVKDKEIISVNLTDKLTNENFTSPGTYIIDLNVGYDKLNINQTIVYVNYDKTVAQIKEELAVNEHKSTEQNEQNVEVTSENQEETNQELDLNNDKDVIISQVEKLQLKEESKAFEQLDEIEKKYNLNSNDSFAGAYLNESNEIVLNFTDSTTSVNISKLTRSKSLSKIKVSSVQNSREELEEFKKDIINEIGTKYKSTVGISLEQNCIIINSLENELSNVKNFVNNLYIVKSSSINIQYKVDNNIIKTFEAAKKVKMGYTYSSPSGGGYYGTGTFGYRAKKKVSYTYVKDGKTKKGKKWIYGATYPNHAGKARKTNVYRSTFYNCTVNGTKRKDCLNIGYYIGKVHTRSHATDTDFIQFNTKYAKPKKQLRGVGGYRNVLSNSKLVVENGSVWKIYRSTYTDAKWVKGNITLTSDSGSFYTDPNYEFEDIIEAKISSTPGDSGGPLITYYKFPKAKTSYKYIIGTTMGSGGGYAIFAKTENSKKALDIVSY